MRFLLTVCAVVASLLWFGAAAGQAAPLDLSHPHYPLVWSTFIQVNYDPAGAGDNGMLTASGMALAVNWDKDTSTGAAGAFELWAEIVPGTGEPVSGYLHVTDGVSTLFHSEKLDAFGFSAEDEFEFQFEQQGDMLAPDGAPVGVILSANSIGLFNAPEDPRFDEVFLNNGNGESDTFWLPEPTTAAFLSVAGLSVVWRRRRRGTQV